MMQATIHIKGNSGAWPIPALCGMTSYVTLFENKDRRATCRTCIDGRRIPRRTGAPDEETREATDQDFLDTIHIMVDKFQEILENNPDIKTCFSWDFDLRVNADSTSMQIVTTITKID